MKNIMSILMLILFITSCCKEDDPQNFYCGAENPVQDLDWLRIEVKEREQFTDSVEVYKMEMPTFGEMGFSVQFEAEGTPLPTQIFYYTCNGTYICSYTGGIVGGDCTGTQTYVVIGELVYKGY